MLNKCRNYLLIILLIITQFSFAYEQSDVVGIVIGGNLYDAKLYKFESNNPSSFLYKYYPQLYKFKFIFLYADDKITVLKDNVQLVIVLGGTEKVVIKKENSPYSVKKMEESSIWCNFVGQVFGLGACVPSVLDTPETKVVTTTKGNPQVTSSEGQNQLKMNLLPAVGSKISYYLQSGKYSLYFAWEGGQPPYAVQVVKIISANCEKVENFLVTQETRVKTEEILFEQGTDYRISIKDSKDDKVDGQFSIVRNEEIIYSHELQKIIEELRPIFRAFLLEQKDKKWSFEAYQMLSKIADEEKNMLAEKLRLRLEMSR